MGSRKGLTVNLYVFDLYVFSASAHEAAQASTNTSVMTFIVISFWSSFELENCYRGNHKKIVTGENQEIGHDIRRENQKSKIEE